MVGDEDGEQHSVSPPSRYVDTAHENQAETALYTDRVLKKTITDAVIIPTVAMACLNQAGQL